ncbi:MAG: hypothetical protein PHV93_02890, partial [Candidatus Pacebacteria bacterium]|nr:hypothetical protein [Candidatus Paceibacterota bacterium]
MKPRVLSKVSSSVIAVILIAKAVLDRLPFFSENAAPLAKKSSFPFGLDIKNLAIRDYTDSSTSAFNAFPLSGKISETLQPFSIQISSVLETMASSIFSWIATPVYASYPITPYAPGETLDPGCAPGTSNCTVEHIYIDPSTLNYGIGTSTPFAKFTVVGQILGEYFTATSTTATSTFPILSATQSSLGTVVSGIWNGTAIGNSYVASGLDVTKLTTGSTLPSNVLSSSLTSLGTLSSLTVSGHTTLGNASSTNLTVTNPITGSVTGNAGTVTNGVYTTDTGTVTTGMILNGTILSADIAAGTIANDRLANGAVATLSGTNSGDVTLTNNVNGLTISGQALTLGLAGTSATGTISAADWNNFNNKVASTTTVNGHPLSSNVTVTKSDVGLGSVENTALSTWAGSTNLTTLGTIGTGTWNGTAIDNAYIASGLDVGKLTVGSTLPSNVVSSSLTSVGTLTNLTVTNPISGSVTGNAANVTGIVAVNHGGTGTSTAPSFGQLL